MDVKVNKRNVNASANFTILPSELLIKMMNSCFLLNVCSKSKDETNGLMITQITPNQWNNLVFAIVQWTIGEGLYVNIEQGSHITPPLAVTRQFTHSYCEEMKDFLNPLYFTQYVNNHHLWYFDVFFVKLCVLFMKIGN